MKMLKPNYGVLLALALIFATPGITAYLYYLNPQWLGTSTTNKGTLLAPPVLFAKLDADKPKWYFVFWQPATCEADCLKQVYKLARVRLALGRHLYEVEEWLVLGEGAQQLPASVASSLQEQDIHILDLAKAESKAVSAFTDKPGVFIANPDGYLVLSYVLTAKPADIYHDIKQLLKSG